MEKLVLQGRQSKSVIVEGGTVTIIKHTTILSAVRKKTIPIRNIGAVDIKKPSMTAGYIQFAIAGGRALNSSYKLTGGAYDAASDENSVLFVGDDNYKIALKMKSYIESFANEPTGAVQKVSAADELLKFKTLLDEGVISQQEFDEQKERLLKA